MVKSKVGLGRRYDKNKCFNRASRLYEFMKKEKTHYEMEKYIRNIATTEKQGRI